MAKPLISIDNFQKGMAQSSYIGYEQIQGIDINNKIGLARVNPKLKKASSTTITGQVHWMVRSPKETNDEIVWALDDDGDVWKNTDTDGTTWAEVAGSTSGGDNGLQYYKDYIFKFRGNSIDAYGPLSGTPVWDNATFGGVAIPVGDHASLVGQDDILYFGGGRYVLSIQEKAGQILDPDNSATYTIKIVAATPALDLPEDYVVVQLAELGSKLMIAANNTETNQSDIFPWDRVSTSFDLPIRFGSENIHTMITVNNLLYVINGREATISVTDGVGVSTLGQIPETYSNIGLINSVTVYPDAIAYFQNKIHFATSYKTSGDIPATVWSFMPTSSGELGLNIAHTIANGNTGTSNTDVDIPSLLTFTDTILMVGYEDSVGTERGVDITDNTKRYTGYTGIIVTPFYRIGTVLNKKTLSKGIVTFVKNLGTGEGMKLYYRQTQTGSWTLHQTFTSATDSFQINDIAGTDHVGVYNIQFKIELTTPSDSESTPELLNIVWA